MRSGEFIQGRKDLPLGFSAMASAPWGEVCPLVAKKRSATKKCGQTLEGRGLIATKSCVSEKTLGIQICIEQLFLQVPTLSSILSHKAPPVFPCVTETCKPNMSLLEE